MHLCACALACAFCSLLFAYASAYQAMDIRYPILSRAFPAESLSAESAQQMHRKHAITCLDCLFSFPVHSVLSVMLYVLSV